MQPAQPILLDTALGDSRNKINSSHNLAEAIID